MNPTKTFDISPLLRQVALEGEIFNTEEEAFVIRLVSLPLLRRWGVGIRGDWSSAALLPKVIPLIEKMRREGLYNPRNPDGILPTRR